LRLIKRKIKDNDLIFLLTNIIKSLDCRFKTKGIPLGNLTSQLFANIVLNELDQFIKHGFGRRHYIRYMDDFLIFSDSKKDLWNILEGVDVFLKD
jgi:retron-type reverse transcriptase